MLRSKLIVAAHIKVVNLNVEEIIIIIIIIIYLFLQKLTIH